MIIRSTPDIPSSEITPQKIYQARRLWGQKMGRLALVGALTPSAISLLGAGLSPGSANAQTGKKIPNVTAAVPFDEKITPYKDITSYNNFYEFGSNKDEPIDQAKNFQVRPWTVDVGGMVAKPGVFDIDKLLTQFPLEERIYRMRCVEGWSMVIPWVGFPLSALIKAVEPTCSAKFVAFQTLYDPKRMPGQNSSVLSWPYVEGLRLDEALNPLTLMAVGLYGETLPNQNGAPLRLVVPWKYGFKGIKSIVRIRLVDSMPPTSWNKSAPHEYGFYSNVNPNVDHPRWSQASERRISEDGLFKPKRRTLMFNGYADKVGQMYTGMDLQRFF